MHCFNGAVGVSGVSVLINGTLAEYIGFFDNRLVIRAAGFYFKGKQFGAADIICKSALVCRR